MLLMCTKENENHVNKKVGFQNTYRSASDGEALKTDKDHDLSVD